MSNRLLTRLQVIKREKYLWYVVLNPKDQNTIRAPWPTTADKKPADGIPYDKPRFDLGVFFKGRREFLDWIFVERGDSSLTSQLRTLARATGATLAATWEGGNVANPNATVTAKFGSSSYEKLLSESRRPLKLGWVTVDGAPLYFGRLAAAAVMKHKLLRPHRRGGRLIHTLLIRHNGRLLPLIGRRGWFGAPYPWRWDEPASCYLDVRIAGKARNRADITCTQAAAREAEETIGCLSTHGHQLPPQHDEHVRAYYRLPRDLLHLGLGLGLAGAEFALPQHDEHVRVFRQADLWRDSPPPRECHSIFYEMPVLGFFWLWLRAALEPEQAPRPYYYSNIFWHKRLASRVSLNEVIDPERVADSKRRDANPPTPVRTVLLEPEEELALARRGKAGDIGARNKIIDAHLPLVKRKTSGMVDLHDIRQACMERLIKVFDDFDPELGVRFGEFAAEAIDWAIQDYLKQRRAQMPVGRSININDPTKDDDEHEEAIEMTNAVYEARLRLIAERLGYLNGRERCIIEGRLALNGSTKAVTLDELADQFGISRGQVQQIERRAAMKLHRAVA